MKNLFFVTLLALVSTSAFASQFPTSRSGTIVSGELDADYGIPAGALQGDISVDPATRKVSLTVESPKPFEVCPKQAECFLAGAPVIQVTLELVDTQADVCGVVTYTAESDRSLLGSSSKIVVQDTTGSTCRMIYEAATIVDYTVQVVAPNAPKHESHLLATKLQGFIFHLPVKEPAETLN